MRLATREDKSLVCDILVESFWDNPSVSWVIQNDEKRFYRMQRLADYAFEYGFRRKGVFLSENGKGVAICYQKNLVKENFSDFWNRIKMAFTGIGLSRVMKVLKRELYMEKQRHSASEYLYCWFLGVKGESRKTNAANDLRKGLFEFSKTKNLPICIETSVLRNKNVYLYFGFKIYHEWEVPGKNLIMWFMKREP